MAEATIPVDLRNPGQVFACLGFMEAAEVLLGEAEGGFDYVAGEIQTNFTISAPGSSDPVAVVIRFLSQAQLAAVAPRSTKLTASGWEIETSTQTDATFPSPIPQSEATLPVRLLLEGKEIAIDHWLDGDHSGRDNVKFWGGSQGKPGAKFLDEALEHIRRAGDNVIGEIVANPFAFDAPMSGSLRFDWRRDYIPLDAGFSPNKHKSAKDKITMVGYPIVEILAAIGLQNARPARIDRRDNLSYRYGTTSVRLPTPLARAVLGGQSLGFPIRLFRMHLGWPGQEGQARCIIDSQEELI
jgi:CRISPR-associated protein Csx14